jgi:hypothetical protein
MKVEGTLYRRREGGAYIAWDGVQDDTGCSFHFVDLPVGIDVEALPDGQLVRLTLDVEPIAEDEGEE